MQQAIAQGRDVSHRLPRYAEQVRKSCELRARRAAGRPAMRTQADLPILEYKTEIAAAIERHQVVIVCGETGSGKSTTLCALIDYIKSLPAADAATAPGCTTR